MTLVPGPCGSIDSSFYQSESRQRPLVLLLPPHPTLEGDMNCAAIRKFFVLFASMGFSVMSFNYRGSGYSSGCFVEGKGEISDAAACLDWARQRVEGASFCWVVGYSFGAYIALQLLMRRPEIGRFIVIDLDSKKSDFSFLAPCPVSGLFLQSEKMHSHCGESTEGLILSLSCQKNAYNSFDLHKIASPNAFSDCFFKNASNVIESYVSKGFDQGLSKGNAASAA